MVTIMNLISIKEAAQKTSLSRSAINVKRSQGDFPEAVELSENRIAFVETEIDEWIAARVAARPRKETKREYQPSNVDLWSPDEIAF